MYYSISEISMLETIRFNNFSFILAAVYLLSSKPWYHPAGGTIALFGISLQEAFEASNIFFSPSLAHKLSRNI